jgi:hypothetical protein
MDTIGNPSPYKNMYSINVSVGRHAQSTSAWEKGNTDKTDSTMRATNRLPYVLILSYFMEVLSSMQ